MSDGKSLKISSSIDTKDISKMQTSLKGLSAEAAKLAASLKAVSNTYKDLSKGLTESAKGFGAFNAGMKTSLDMFKQSKSEINQMIGMVNRLGSAMRSAGGLPQMGGGVSASGAGAGGYSYTSGSGAPQQTSMAGGQVVLPPGLAPPPPSFHPVPGGGQVGRRGDEGFNSATAASARAFSTLSDVFSKSMTAPLQRQQNIATIQQATYGNILQKGYGGDLATFAALNDPETLKELYRTTAFGTDLSLAKDVAGYAGKMVGAGASGGGGAAVGIGVEAAVDLLTKSETEERRAEVASMMPKLIQARIEQKPGEQLMYQHLQATAGVRMQLAPLTQGRGTEAQHMGAGYGLGAGETLGALNPLISKFGATAAMGGGKEGPRGLFGLSQELGLAGYDTGAVGQMMGQMTGGMSGGTAGRPEEAFKKLEAVFQKAVAAGIKDSALSQQIGEEVANQSLKGGGGQNLDALGDALVNAVTRGGTKQVTSTDINAMRSGIGIVGGLAGQNPLIASQMMTSLRKQGITDEFQQNWLMTAGMENLVTGGGATGAAFFGSQEKAQAAGKAHIGDAIGLALQQFGSGSDWGSKTKSMLDRYGDYSSAIKKDPSFAKHLAAGLKYSGALPGEEMDIAKGLEFSAFGSENKKMDKGKLGRHYDTGRDYRSAAERAQLKIQEKEGDNTKGIMDSMKSMVESVGKFADMPTTLDATQKTFDALKELIVTINESTIPRINELNKYIKNSEKHVKGSDVGAKPGQTGAQDPRGKF